MTGAIVFDCGPAVAAPHTSSKNPEEQLAPWYRLSTELNRMQDLLVGTCVHAVHSRAAQHLSRQ